MNNCSSSSTRFVIKLYLGKHFPSSPRWGYQLWLKFTNENDLLIISFACSIYLDGSRKNITEKELIGATSLSSTTNQYWYMFMICLNLSRPNIFIYICTIIQKCRRLLKLGLSYKQLLFCTILYLVFISVAFNISFAFF